MKIFVNYKDTLVILHFKKVITLDVSKLFYKKKDFSHQF